MAWQRLGTRLMVLALWGLSQGVPAQEPCEQPVGRLASVEGSVEVQRADTGEWHVAIPGEGLCQGDTIRVGERSRAAVSLASDVVLRLDQDTTMRLLDISEEPKERSLLEVLKGALQSFSRKPRLLSVNTPYLNGLIEGTEFVVRVEEDRGSIAVLEGRVAAENPQGRIEVAPGEAATALAGKAPLLQTVVRPRDAVQWALYYPPVLTLSGGDVGGRAGDGPPLREAVERAARGDTTGALGTLDRVAGPDRDARYHLYRAALLLSVGQAAEARVDIDAALIKDPNAGLGYALRSIIHVAQNEREKALADAEHAVQLSPTAASRIALSYAQQADFRIEAARDTLRSAAEQHPDDPLAWARLGELHLMLGDRGEARMAARKAASIAPDLARTQLVLGFADLAEFRNKEARAAFERAIALSSADPLGHLGLGLAKISDGDLAEGRQELEVAVGLDANNALLRAYLGKAYFEEKRDPLDAQQYGIAKSLDPADPTAYLYDAIRKQTENRPGEALQDLQASIDRNDNRAVYRSRLLLDKDRAARGTSLARVYKDLEFTQLGLRQSAESLALDPSNASAHRFLSDAYLGVRRREIARVSELLQAQLLQDTNINPVQPSITVTNLNVVTIGGPATPGFNEFTPLFGRNTAQLDVSGFGGNNNTYGGEGVFTALYDRFSISAGAYYYNSDGWRDNNDLNHHIENIFAQVALTDELNIQTEFRHRDSEEGDLDFNFDPADFLRDKTVVRDQDTARVGLRYSPTRRSTFLVSYIYNDLHEDTDESEPFDPSTTLTSDIKANDAGDQIEAQYIYQQDWFNLIAGFGYSEVDRKKDGSLLLTNISPPIPLLEIPLSSTAQIHHPHGYVYANVNFPEPVTWTLGASYDDYEQEPLDETSFNPKFGVLWYVTDNFRLRGAAFRALKPALVTNRTIEPTQIAGFNQFFDDINATRTTRFGVGFDWQLTRDVSMGAEAAWRDLDEPLFISSASGEDGVLFEDRDEQYHDLYIFWTPTDRFAVKSELIYDHFENEIGPSTDPTVGGDLPKQVETLSVPLGVTYFDPTGLFAAVGGTYVHQDVERFGSVTEAQGTDGFFLVDTAVGYRLPKRYGAVSLGVKNLFDIEFKYQDDSFREFRTEPSTGPYFPDRTILFRITLNL